FLRLTVRPWRGLEIASPVPATSSKYQSPSRQNTIRFAEARHALQSRFLFVEVGEAGSFLDASFRKARLTTGLSNRSGKEDQLMILLLVKFSHALCGRLTVMVLWRRKAPR